MPRQTRGRDALRAWLREQKTPQAAFAARLGVEQSLVSQWVMGTARPSHVLRAAVSVICDIPESAWLDDAERQKLQRMCAPAS